MTKILSVRYCLVILVALVASARALEQISQTSANSSSVADCSCDTSTGQCYPETIRDSQRVLLNCESGCCEMSLSIDSPDGSSFSVDLYDSYGYRELTEGQTPTSMMHITSHTCIQNYPSYPLCGSKIYGYSATKLYLVIKCTNALQSCTVRRSTTLKPYHTAPPPVEKACKQVGEWVQVVLAIAAVILGIVVLVLFIKILKDKKKCCWREKVSFETIPLEDVTVQDNE